MKTIDMKQYGKSHPADANIRFYLTLEEGKAAAEACKLKEAVLAGPVDVRIEDRGLSFQTRNTVTEAWLKGFVGPVARKIGIDLFVNNVTFNGNKIDQSLFHWTGSAKIVQSYLAAEEKRLERDREAKARKEGTTTWSAPGQLLIPDIGTVVQVTEDWKFRLFEERRNASFLANIGIMDLDFYRRYREGGSMREFKVIVLAGTSLGVDRVYIRKGADDYSSITFNMYKGGQVVVNGKTVKVQGRFWAKLSDVNRMKVRMDMSTLAVN